MKETYITEYTAKTAEEALNQAISAKQCKVEELVYEVVSENKHLFGIGNTVTIKAFAPQDVKDFIFDYFEAYFTNLDQNVAIEIFMDEGVYKVILDAENNALIIGKNGQTLRAIATVLKAAVNSTFKKRINVLIDINHYREDRYRKVKSLANRVAKEVLNSHTDASLDPMPNDERKVIHQFLANREHIKTESEGEGSQRHLIIKYVD